MSTYSIYTYYKADGSPLYIGKSKDIYKRHLAHKNDVWMQDAEKIGVRNYLNEREMDIAEIYYIASAHPKYNVTFQTNSDFTEDSMRIRFEDYSEENINTIEDFCELYRPKHKGVHVKSKPKKRKLHPEEKAAQFHKNMQVKYDVQIVSVSEPTAGSICSIFTTTDRIIRVGNGYYGSKFAFTTNEERNKRNAPKPPSEEARKRFVAAWLAEGNENPFVVVKVKLIDQDDFVRPLLYYESINSSGDITSGFHCLGSGTMRYYEASRTMIYNLPSINSVVEYIRTREDCKC